MLTGTWSLGGFAVLDAAGAVVDRPWGEHPVGLLIYTGDGHMSAQFMLADRTPFRGGSQRGGSDAEKIAVAKEFFAYSGTYRVTGDVVEHRVLVTSYPNHLGRVLRRTVRLDGDTLVLTTEPNAAGTRSALTWHRTLAD
ncbi:lipocalin-like domain-containing protein [Actinokineospora soli]|uniref:Lipocalin-like domain-containing protein n=1 Tax=Actinokineospora soli TaxID=1048753 RepID=A0ABW2TQG9_9PSEU